MRRYITNLFYFLLIGLVIACSNNEDNITLQPGSYGRVIRISVNNGHLNENLTKVIDDQTQLFTGVYDADYIYLHSKDNPEKVLRFTVSPEVDCDDNCEGFEMYMNVDDNGNITIYNYDRNTESAPTDTPTSITLSAEENVYFSSWPTDTWEATRVIDDGESEVSPITQQPVFIRDEEKNVELYRSEEDFTANSLHSLAGINDLDMKRVCSAYQVRCVITNTASPTIPNNYYLSEQGWLDLTNTSSLDKWTIKLYLGPLFPQYYNINTNNVYYDEEYTGGYYVTNQQNYTAFQAELGVSQPNSSSSGSTNYTGVGLVTNEQYVITPIRETDSPDNAPIEGNYSYAYIFVKYNSSDSESDVGAKYIEVPLPRLNGVLNQTEIVNIVINAENLKEAFADEIAASGNQTAADTRNLWEVPQKLEIVPITIY